jgi:hypothetical protein
MTPLKTEHKKQLHEQILLRCSELEGTLSTMHNDERLAVSDRARAIEGALAALETHLSGGWEVIGEVEAAELTRWLDTTNVLYEPNAAPRVTSAVWARLEARWKLEQYKMPKPELAP